MKEVSVGLLFHLRYSEGNVLLSGKGSPLTRLLCVLVNGHMVVSPKS